MKTFLLNPLLIFLWIFPFSGHAQYITISGYVAHLFTGNAIENVNVFETRTGIGTITNKDGFFKLILKPGNFDISFALNGYKPVIEQFSVKSDTILNMALEPLKWLDVQDKNDSETKTIDNKNDLSHRKKFFLFL